MPKKGVESELYIEGPLRSIWNAEGIMHQKSWILYEAIIDALTLWTFWGTKCDLLFWQKHLHRRSVGAIAPDLPAKGGHRL